ncbi:ABC transporter substrate binding protein [Streptococcus iniae]|nr:ABC transporter substrate binding protein [Streptococcus iniae]
MKSPKKAFQALTMFKMRATSLMQTADALFVPTDNTIASTMTMLGQLSLEHKVPIIGGSTDMVDQGGLLTYGTNYKALGKQVGKQAVQILKGKSPAKIPVEKPANVQVHVNVKQAKALGIDVSGLSEKK